MNESNEYGSATKSTATSSINGARPTAGTVGSEWSTRPTYTIKHFNY
jgi:hypothetical protein